MTESSPFLLRRRRLHLLFYYSRAALSPSSLLPSINKHAFSSLILLPFSHHSRCSFPSVIYSMLFILIFTFLNFAQQTLLPTNSIPHFFPSSMRSQGTRLQCLSRRFPPDSHPSVDFSLPEPPFPCYLDSAGYYIYIIFPTIHTKCTVIYHDILPATSLRTKLLRGHATYQWQSNEKMKDRLNSAIFWVDFGLGNADSLIGR